LCSAGIGRTGAYIAIDSMVERIMVDQPIDIYGFVRSLRAQRSFMVKMEEQYVFIYEAALDAGWFFLSFILY
jgi:netrin-G3 ligand